MSLYTHIVSKDELLALMANELIGTLLVDEPLPDDWREALSLTSRRTFRMFASHPWLLSLLTHRPRQGPNAARQAKQLARGCRGPEVASRRPVDVAQHRQRLRPRSRVACCDDGEHDRPCRNLSEQDKAELPAVEALAGTEATRLAGEVFELGLQAVLDGVERRFVSVRS